jgi:hypothetical protein
MRMTEDRFLNISATKHSDSINKVFHHTDTSLYLLSLALALSIHNKLCRLINQHCGDVELVVYLANAAGPVPLVLDLRIAHDRFGSSDPILNGQLHYPGYR